MVTICARLLEAAREMFKVFKAAMEEKKDFS